MGFRVSGPVTMYTTTWCGYCRRLEREMTEAGINFDKIDIDGRSDLGERIEVASGGNRTVPTVEIGGELLVNPSIEQVVAAVGGPPGRN